MEKIIIKAIKAVTDGFHFKISAGEEMEIVQESETNKAAESKKSDAEIIISDIENHIIPKLNE